MSKVSWEIKQVAYEEGSPFGRSYEVSKEVEKLLDDGWEPFSVTFEQGGFTTHPWLWLKRKKGGDKNG